MGKVLQSRTYVGGFSAPSKMPGHAYSTPAEDCKTGSKLRGIPDSVCSDCYACKGNYIRFPAVMKAMKRRLGTLDKKYWVDNMVTAINGAEFFRWHDSGDLQSEKHLDRIVQVSRRTPGTSHWLPTRENGFVRGWLKKNPGGFPRNLVVRVSANMIDQRPGNYPNTSTVHRDSEPVGHVCPSSLQGNECRDCRACWTPSVANISYPKH